MNDVVPPEITEFLLNPVVIAVAVGLLILWFVINGLSMKWSLSLAGGKSVGFFWACAIVSVMTVVSSLVQFAVTVAFAPAPWLTMIYGVAATVLCISLLARCGLLKAFAVSVCYGFFATFGCLFAAVSCALILVVAIDQGTISMPDEFKQLAENYEGRQPSSLGELRETLGGVSVGASTVNGDDLQSLFFETPASSDDPTRGLDDRSAPAPETGSPAPPVVSGEAADQPPEDASQRMILPEGVQTNPFAR